MDRRFLSAHGKSLDTQIILRPILRAYALGYFASTAPKLLLWLRRLLRKDLSYKSKIEELIRVTCGAVGVNTFPAFCAAVVGCSTALPVLFSYLYVSIRRKFGSTVPLTVLKGPSRRIRFLFAFLPAWFGFLLLNRRHHNFRNHHINSDRHYLDQQDGLHPSNPDTEVESVSDLAGRTLDLTFYTVTGALDVIACIAWDRWRRRRKAKNRWTLMESLAPELTDAGVFAVSAAMVMWAWFYLPERLPHSYEKWIGEIANVDQRLVEALRRARGGDYVYGKDNGQASLLGSMCEDHNWPVEWGDPAKTIPIPCQIVHMGHGPSCEWHAVSRFAQTFKFTWTTYFPLQLLLRIRTKQPGFGLIRATKDATRSSMFIALFVSIFYYSVCLARTRLGPKLFDRKTVTPMMWDSGLCIGAGCLMCGWSIFIESPLRRQEIAFFVAPRAVATMLPRQYHRQYLYREQAAFALSAAIILTCIQEQPKMVRGFLGKILTFVLM